jgi:hypothetical protein
MAASVGTTSLSIATRKKPTILSIPTSSPFKSRSYPFGRSGPTAPKLYREFVREGVANRPWEELRGQVYLGSEKFIEKHSPANIELKEIPRAQLKLERIFATSGEKAIAEAYEQAIGSMRSQRIWRPLCDGEPQTQTARAIELKNVALQDPVAYSLLLIRTSRTIPGNRGGFGREWDR